MNQTEFKQRTKFYALDIIRFVDGIPRSMTTDVIIRQLVRSATSVAANYRAACRGKSTPDFIAKLGIVEEEADETLFWLEMLLDSGKVDQNPKMQHLIREGNEILAMTVASIRTSRTKLDNSKTKSNPQSEIHNPKL